MLKLKPCCFDAWKTENRHWISAAYRRQYCIGRQITTYGGQRSIVRLDDDLFLGFERGLRTVLQVAKDGHLHFSDEDRDILLLLTQRNLWKSIPFPDLVNDLLELLKKL